MLTLIADFIAAPFRHRSPARADLWSNRFLPCALSEARHDRGFNPQRNLCW